MLGQGQASRGGDTGARGGYSGLLPALQVRAASGLQSCTGSRSWAEGRGSGEAPAAWGPQREVAGSWGRQLERGRRLGLLTHRLTGLGPWPALWSLGFLTCNTGRIR